jgi:hypothetical protein
MAEPGVASNFIAREKLHPHQGNTTMRVPDDFLQSVGFVGVKYTKDGRDVFRIGGTGFFVSVASVKYPNEIEFNYFVTARHNIERASRIGPIFVRLNTKDGRLAYVEITRQWEFPDRSAVDLAVLSWGRQEYDYNFRSIPEKFFAHPKYIDNLKIGIGDDLCIVGLFSQIYGVNKNLPIVRSGIIAAMPVEPFQDDSGELYHAYLAEARSIGGLSGSPVIVVVDPIRPGARRGEPPWSPHPLYLLLGVVRGHWDVNKTIVEEDFIDNEMEQVNMGIAIVTPIDDLGILLHNEELTKERKQGERDYEKDKSPKNPILGSSGQVGS